MMVYFLPKYMYSELAVVVNYKVWRLNFVTCSLNEDLPQLKIAIVTLHNRLRRTSCVKKQLEHTQRLVAGPNNIPGTYSTDQMQGISLMRLSLAPNTFIANNECVYH